MKLRAVKRDNLLIEMVSHPCKLASIEIEYKPRNIKATNKEKA